MIIARQHKKTPRSWEFKSLL